MTKQGRRRLLVAIAIAGATIYGVVWMTSPPRTVWLAHDRDGRLQSISTEFGEDRFPYEKWHWFRPDNAPGILHLHHAPEIRKGLVADVRRWLQARIQRSDCVVYQLQESTEDAGGLSWRRYDR